MANLATNVPLVNEAFVDPKTGNITESWFLFLIQLWRRTGGGGGGDDTTITIDDVFSVETVPIVAMAQQISALTQEVETLRAQLRVRDESFANETVGI